MFSKRGQFTDIFILVLTLFLFAVGFIVFGYVYPQVASGLNSTGLFNTTEQQQAIGILNATGTQGINEAYLFFVGGLILVQLVTSYLVRYNPVFILIFIVMMVINVLLAMYLSNAFDTFADPTLNPTFATTFQQQPIISFFWEHMLAVIIIVDILSIFILFSKVGGESPV